MPRWNAICQNEKAVTKLELETDDSQELVRLWARGDNPRSCLAPILWEIRKFSSGFLDFTLLYASRSCDRIAHVLAKQVTGDTRLGEWQFATACIVNLLAKECNSHTP